MKFLRKIRRWYRSDLIGYRSNPGLLIGGPYRILTGIDFLKVSFSDSSRLHP